MRIKEKLIGKYFWLKFLFIKLLKSTCLNENYQPLFVAYQLSLNHVRVVIKNDFIQNLIPRKQNFNLSIQKVKTFKERMKMDIIKSCLNLHFCTSK